MTTSSKSETFVDYTTPAVDADWLNGVNRHVYNSPPTPFDDLTQAQTDAIKEHTSTLDATSYIQDAIDWQDAGTEGSFQVDIRDGRYEITGTGTNILTLQNGIKFTGSSLEGTLLSVDDAATSTVVIGDDGSAAKLELSNFTVFGNDNANALYGIKLGATTQFGTYGTMDNVMVRDLPNATGIYMDNNAIALGKLYVMDCENGVISDEGGSATHIDSVWPIGFSGIGLQQALGDHVTYIEAEGPASNDAIPIHGKRGLNVGSFVLSIGTGRTVRAPIVLDPTYVDDFYIGKTNVIKTGTGNVGDTTSPDESGTFESAGSATATDTNKTWQIDEWMGAYVHITGGTGSGQIRRVLQNSRNTLTVDSVWTTSLDATSQYKMSYFIRKSTDNGSTYSGGYAHSESLTAYWPAFYNLSVTNYLRANSVTTHLISNPTPAPTIASASTIAPTTGIVFISGTTTIQTITAPSTFVGGGTIILIPTGLWSTGTSGNIALATTAVVSRALHMTYDTTTDKWYPSYT